MPIFNVQVYRWSVHHSFYECDTENYLSYTCIIYHCNQKMLKNNTVASRINNMKEEVMNVSEIFIKTSVKVCKVYAMGL